MNSYIVFVESERIEVFATTSYAAQQAAVKLAKSRKKYPRISVNLVELAGKPVTTTITN